MTFTKDDARVAAYVGFVMGIWVSPFLMVGTVGAIYGAPKTYAPLVITLLLTSIATASVSVWTSSVNGKTNSAEAAGHRSVSTFIFVNSAGTMVGLVTNVSAALESWSSGGPNGLTYLYEQVFGQSMPVGIYAFVLILMVIAAARLVVRGSALISPDRKPSEKELNTLGGWSGSLLSLWIFTCMPWQPLGIGAEAVASIWTATVYAGMIVFGACLYGFAGIRLVRWLASVAYRLARDATTILSDPKTWRTLLIVLSVLAASLLVLFATYFTVGWLTKEIATISNELEPKRAAEAFEISTSAFLWTLEIIGKTVAGVIILIVGLLLPSLIRLAWRFILSLRVSYSPKLPKIKVTLPKLSPHWASLLKYFKYGIRMLLAGLVNHRALLYRTVLVIAPALFLVATSTNGIQSAVPTDQDGPQIDAEPPLEPLIPADLPISMREVSLVFEPISLCRISPGAAEWTYESQERVSVDLSECQLGARFEPGDALIVAAMSTNGARTAWEEDRSERRLSVLMNWARDRELPIANIYGLDLGMAESRFSHAALSSVFGASWSKRPLIGIKISSDVQIEPWMVRIALVNFINKNKMIRMAYSECSAYLNYVSASTKLLDCNESLPLDYASLNAQ